MTRSKGFSVFKLLPPLAVLLLSSCSNLVLFNPRGQVGQDEKSLILTAIFLMLIVVIPVFILTLVFAIKYRASNRKAKYSPNWGDSAKIETVMWLIPVMIIVVLATVTWITTHKLDPYKPLEVQGKPITIQAVSMDWKWLFIYPEQGIASVNEVAFPAGVQVDFQITSDTVMNSFFIPQLGSQIYAMTGMETQLHIIADEPGTYDGMSANYSGAGFSDMNFKALAMTRDNFESWVRNAKSASRKLNQSNYAELAKPSRDNPVTYYSSVESHMFDSIVREYMHAGSDKQE